MKLLIITPYCIVPAVTGGQIRVFELARSVSQLGIRTTIAMPLTFNQISHVTIHSNLLLRPVPYPFILPLLFTDKPFSYNFLISLHPGYAKLLKKWIKTHDIIQFEGASFGDLTDTIPKDKIVVYDAHNVEFDYESGEGRSKWARSIAKKRIGSFEQKLVQRANQILTCSERDSERLAERYKKPLEKCCIVPNGIHLNKQSQQFNTKQMIKKFPGFLNFKKRAIFSGSNVAHNRVAVKFIVEDLAPKVQKEWAFLIRGPCGNPFKNQKVKNLFFDRTPGNVTPFADVCTAAVNPITQGSGTSLKVLDFLASGLPVISTNFGMRGFEDLKKYVTIANLNQFGEALKNPLTYHPIIKKKLAKYEWTSIGKNLYNIYSSIMKSNFRK